MERVETLSNLLAEKIQKKASVTELLQTVKMLESELLHLRNITPPPTVIDNSSTAINISTIQTETTKEEVKLEIDEPKIVEVLKIDEADVEAELEAIKKNVEQRNHLSYLNRQPISFEGADEVPTLANRHSIFSPEETNASVKELNELFPTEKSFSTKDADLAPTKEVENIANNIPIKELNESFPTENTTSINEKFVAPVKEVGDIFNDVPKKELNEILAQKNNGSLNEQLASTNESSKPLSVFEINEMNKTIIEMGNMQTEKNITPAINSTKELNEVLPSTSNSLNDRLNKSQTQVSDTLSEAPIKDLKKAIGVNERFLYLNELFRGDEAMYERSIKTINAFNVYPEAELWIRRELKLKLGWDEKYQTVKQFDQLIKRRFA
jgi:hypothetical protein